MVYTLPSVEKINQVLNEASNNINEQIFIEKNNENLFENFKEVFIKMNEWNLYIDKWALVKNINVDLVKELKTVFLEFLYKNNIETTLRENFQLLLLGNIDKFEKEIFSLIINFVVWFYKEINISFNKFQIDDLISNTKGISFTNGKEVILSLNGLFIMMLHCIYGQPFFQLT